MDNTDPAFAYSLAMMCFCLAAAALCLALVVAARIVAAAITTAAPRWFTFPPGNIIVRSDISHEDLTRAAAGGAPSLKVVPEPEPDPEAGDDGDGEADSAAIPRQR